MASVNFGLLDAVNLYTKLFTNVFAFPLIALLLLIFVAIVMINIDNRNLNFVFTGINVLIIGFICWNHGLNIIDNLDTFKDPNLFKNVYFYLTNMIISLLLISSVLQNKKREKPLKYIIAVFYYLILVNLIQMLFMSQALQNIMIVVLGNTYPMIYFGNITAFVMYGVLLIYVLVYKKKTVKHRLGNHV